MGVDQKAVEKVGKQWEQIRKQWEKWESSGNRSTPTFTRTAQSSVTCTHAVPSQT